MAQAIVFKKTKREICSQTKTFEKDYQIFAELHCPRENKVITKFIKKSVNKKIQKRLIQLENPVSHCIKTQLNFLLFLCLFFLILNRLQHVLNSSHDCRSGCKQGLAFASFYATKKDLHPDINNPFLV